MKPNYNSKRSDFRANENHVKINQPLSQEYQDYAKIDWFNSKKGRCFYGTD